MPSSRRHDRRGFTLVEVLLALSLLAAAGVAAVGLLTQLARSSHHTGTEVEVHTTAVAVIESLLTRDWSALAPTTATGISAGGVAWTLTVADEATDLRRLTVDARADGAGVVLQTLVSNR